MSERITCRLIRVICAFAIFATFAALSPAHAQPRLPALHPAGVEFSVGAGRGSVANGGANKFGVALSAMLSWHAPTDDGNRDGLQVAVNASQQSSFSFATADDTDFPRLRSLAVLGGWSAQQENLGPSLRALAGPAFVQSSFSEQSLGLQGRIDASSNMRGRVALIAFGQWLIAPSLTPARHFTQAYGIGWRIR